MDYETDKHIKIEINFQHIKMKNLFKLVIVVLMLAFLSIATQYGCTSKNTPEREVKRVGMVIKIRQNKIEEYKKLHAPDNPGVRDLLSKYNMYNFSIFLQKLDDGNYYEFGYYEYNGEDFKADMAKLAKEPRNIEWLKVCDPMQVPIKGYKSWAEMEQVYFNE